MSEALSFVEIDIRYCALTYGIAPCTASLTSSPPTGTAKCFNGLATCQDTPNIDLQDVTLRFSMEANFLPRDIDIVAPSIISVDFSPAIVSLGENLGQRASLKVTFKDHKHSDTGEGFDKYYAERSYNPYEQGTFWGRFRARQPFLRGVQVRWLNGLLGETIADMETRHFFIESFDGLTTDGKFSITAKDALKFLDGDRAQAPLLSNGFLVAAIDDADTSATLSPTGIGNAEYHVSGLVCIGGNEICGFTRSGDTLTLARGAITGIPSSHNAGDRVQLCLVYSALDPADIINDLVTNYTDTPAGYVPLIDWQTETGTNLNRLYSTVITEPTAVNKLVSEIVQQAALAIWDDNEQQKLRLQVLRGIPTDAEIFNESNVMKGTFTVADQPDKRVSQVWVYFGQIDPTKRVDDPDNYRSCKKVPEDASEAEANFGAPAIMKVFARWIPATGGSTIAQTLGQKILSRYETAPRKFSFEVWRQNAPVLPQLGAGYRLEWWNLQEADGSRSNIPIQVTRLLPGPASIKVDAEEMLFTAPVDDLEDRQIVIDSNINNINLKSVHDSLFPPLEPGQSVTFTIAAGVIVGSASTSAYAVEVGTWSGSPTINLIVLGRIEGKAGNGGKGGNQGGNNGSPGANGGGALFSRQAINLTDASGQTWGGGGGGGGGGSAGAFPGGGGGGGAGQLPGAAGAAGSGSNSSAAGQPGTTESAGAGGANPMAGGDGGAGGGPGLAGSAGQSGQIFSTVYNGGAGGSPGLAIDGISFVTTVGSAGDRRGGTAN